MHGMDVFDIVKYTTIYEQIEKANPEVKAYEINPTFCDARSKRNINADNMEFLCDSIKAICNNTDKNFILAYSDNPDTLLHKYGCNSKEVKEFVKEAEERIKKMCLKLKNSNSLFIITADHGHKDIEKIYNILDLEEIQDFMIMPASLESRAITFWIKPNKKERFEKYFKNKFKEEFILYTKEEFLEKKLLGFGIPHKKIEDFLGDYIAISIGNAIIKLESNISKPKKDKKSTHCGFTKEEMEVPLIVI